MATYTESHESAFPVYEANYTQGMTMREWYAGLAMQGIAAAIINSKEYPYLKASTIAQTAFEIADAMLVEAKGEKHE